ncbi:MAG: hypothetical protein HFI69_09070 [Lachnospiraceae bacterium]|nr:hypothetical protein [Lachnospiraceae bacterium]
MIERKDILSVPYLKKTTFTGSYEGLRFRFAVVKREAESKEGEEQGGERQVLEITAWEAPYCYDATPEEKKLRIDREFSEEGIQQGIEWLNELWNAEPEKWNMAKTNF